MPFNTELHRIYHDCYEPVIRDNNLYPVVLSENRDGNPLYSQIISNIQECHLIIGDLTIARPNCYFEVGYAIGHGKQDNLILCCKYDHSIDHPDNPRQNSKAYSLFNLVKSFLPNSLVPFFDRYFSPLLDQYKIHFDLSNYNILWWHQARKEEFKKLLDQEIKQRLILIGSKYQHVGSTIHTKQMMMDDEIKRRFESIEQDGAKDLLNAKK